MAMETQPRFIKRHLKAEALALVRQGDYHGAITKYQQYLDPSLDPNPQDDDAWAGLGGAYRRKGDLDEAIACYEKAYQLQPQSTYALVNIVSLRAARNTKDDQEKLKTYLPRAIKLTKQIIDEGKGDYWTWYDLATLQLLQGDAEDAVRTFTYAADSTPKTAKENFRSVLNNLNFLKQRNPTLAGIAQKVIPIIEKYLEESTS